MISYAGLEKILKEKGIGKTELSTEAGLSTRTVAKIAKGEKLSARSLNRIAGYLNVAPELLCRKEADNKILQLLRDEKEIQLSGGLYHELQVRMTYNSNHMEGSKPSEVARDMRALLERYNAKDNVTIDDIIEFHAEFEYIHPFQDGNGRVGRLIALKECLKNNVIPFIIEDSKKSFYYRGLSEWRRENGWLVDTCLDGQDTFVKLLDMLEIPHE